MNLLIFNLKTDADDSVLGFTTDWINALAACCHRVIVITMMAGRLAVAANVKVYSVGKEKGYSEPRRLLEFYRRLGTVLREEKINACFAHMMPLFAVLGWPMLKRRGIPIVLWYAHSHVSLLLRLATVLVDRVVASSPSGFRIDTPKFRSIGQGIDVERFVPVSQRKSDEQKLTLLTVGRISRVKRLEVPLKALCLLSEGIRQRIELRYVGDPLGDDGFRHAAELRQRVETLDLHDAVHFEPALPFHCVQEAYQAADIFINTSDTDSIDKTVLEAMSCGLPIITSNVAFIDVLGPELTRDWLIPKNDAGALALRLQSLVEMSSDERRVLGLRLRDIVESDHSLPALAGRLLNELTGLIRLDDE
jgi:glycosyltransferase involved in cell wall biosynthesis